jgi:hypothetical protein
LISVSLGDASAVTRRDGARFGLAKNERLIAEIATELDGVAAKSRRAGRTERRFKSFMWTTRRTRAGGASAPASGVTNPASNAAPSNSAARRPR